MNFKRIIKNRSKLAVGAVALGTFISSCSGYAFCIPSDPDGNPQFKPPHIRFRHQNAFGIYDYCSVRRGVQVFKEVLSPWHYCENLTFGNLVGVTHTLEQAEKIANEFEIIDGPNEEGKMFKRMGKLTDHWPKPHLINEENSDSTDSPTDLSIILKGSSDIESHVFQFLTGYHKIPPPGVEIAENSYYNMYAPGQVTTLPPLLKNGLIQYDDGTPATVSQMARDLATFLRWSVDPNLEERKRNAIKSLSLLALALPFLVLFNRLSYNLLRYRQVSRHKINWK